MTILKTSTASFPKTSILDLTHCCTEPFNCHTISISTQTCIYASLLYEFTCSYIFPDHSIIITRKLIKYAAKTKVQFKKPRKYNSLYYFGKIARISHIKNNSLSPSAPLIKKNILTLLNET